MHSDKNPHLSDEDLVLHADGELSSRRRKQTNAHLEACWYCRERMLSLEETIVDFVRARNRELSSQLPAANGPRALIRARLAELASRRERPSTRVWRSAVGPVAFIAAILGILILFQTAVNAEGPKPKSLLTPGETRPITLAEVCRTVKAEVISRNIPEETQRRVFAAYGIRSSATSQFEVDYLITPDLGGADSIRNLWPQPYSARWNARVKDQLEQRLHQLVCSGQLVLGIAQHDIAVDWIAAYKKYVGGSPSL